MLSQRQLHVTPGLQTPPVHIQGTSAALQRASSSSSSSSSTANNRPAHPLLLRQQLQASQLLVTPAAAIYETRHSAQQQQQQQQWREQQQQQQLLPGRSLHSQQTEELLRLLQSAAATSLPAATAARATTQQQQHDRSAVSQHHCSSSHTEVTAAEISIPCFSTAQGSLLAGPAPRRAPHLAVAAQRQQQLWPSQQQQQQLRCPASNSEAALLVQELRQCTKPQQLLAFLSALAVDLDAVAVSAAVLHYARLVVPAAGSSSSSSGESSSHRLPNLLRHLLLHHVGGFKARQLANTVYALGRMHCRDKGLVDPLLQGLNPKVVLQLNAQELANIAWGLGKLRVWPDTDWMEGFYKAVGLQLTQKRQKYQRQQQQQEAMHAAGAVAIGSSSSSRPISRQCQQQRCAFKPQELANLIWGLGRLHATPPKPWLQLVLPVLEQQAPGFTAQQLSNISWGLAQMGGTRPKCPGSSSSSSSSACSVSSSTYNSSSRGSKWLHGVELDRFLVQVSAAAQHQLAGFSPQELSCLVWGVARLQQQQQEWQQQQQGRPCELGSRAAAAAAGDSNAPSVLSIALQLTAAACSQVAAAATPGRSGAHTAAAAAGQQQPLQAYQQSNLQHSSSSSRCISRSGSTSAQQYNNQQLNGYQQSARTVWGQQATLQTSTTLRLQQQQQVGPQWQRQQQQQLVVRRRDHVQPSHLAMILQTYRMLSLQQQQQQQQLAAPVLLQQVLNRLASVLGSYSAYQLHSSSSSSSNIQGSVCYSSCGSSGSSSSSSGDDVWGCSTGPLLYKPLPACEVSGFCSSLLLLCQLGFSPRPRYMSAALEVIHDKLHVLNPQDFEAVTACLEVLGYMPSKPWTASFLQAVQPKLGGLSPEGLVDLLNWALKAERWIGKTAIDSSSSSGSGGSSTVCITGAAVVSLPAHHDQQQQRQQQQQQQQQQQAGVKLLPGVVVQDGAVLQAVWLKDLVVALRAKVGCRHKQTAAAAAARNKDSSHSSSSSAASDPAASVLQNVRLLDKWLQQQLSWQQTVCAIASKPQQWRRRRQLVAHLASVDSSTGHIVQSYQLVEQQQQQHFSKGTLLKHPAATYVAGDAAADKAATAAPVVV